MQIIKRGYITYYVKDEAVVVGIHDFQFIAYTVYSLQNRKPFYDFRRTILKSGEDELGTIVEQLKLAKKHNLKAVASHKPKDANETE